MTRAEAEALVRWLKRYAADLPDVDYWIDLLEGNQ